VRRRAADYLIGGFKIAHDSRDAFAHDLSYFAVRPLGEIVEVTPPLGFALFVFASPPPVEVREPR
jgi:hypothetical protein